MNGLERIGEFLVTGQPGPSLTWRTEKKNCAACGREFDAQIATQDGQDKPYVTECQACRQKKRDEENRQAALERLKQAKEEQRAVWVESCGVPTRFWGKTFENFKREFQPKAFDVIKAFNSETSILLLSPNIYGVGKTHLVCALVQHLIDTKEPAGFRHDSSMVIRRSLPALYIAETELIARIRATFNRQDGEGGESEEDIYRQLANVSLLIIDDVGKVKPRDYSFLQSVYFRVIDTRYKSESPVILTTNLEPSELETHIGGACADRLREMCGPNIVKMAGTSYRQKAKVGKS